MGKQENYPPNLHKSYNNKKN